jgi:predicted metal-dependent phosphoesterase TrpH
MSAKKYTIDLHVHSRFSGDTDSEPEESVIWAVELGLSGIAFTEHSSYEASEFVEGLKEKYGEAIRIFRGVEFSCSEGHCLVFGANTDRLLPRHSPLEEVIKRVAVEGGVVIPSHPYRGGHSLGDLIREVHGLCAIEGYNGANMHAFNVRAMGAAKDLGLPFTGGSDAHNPREVGSCFTEFDDEVTYDNFIGLLTRGRYRGVDTRKISKWLF